MKNGLGVRMSVWLVGWLVGACLAAWIVKSTVVSVSRISSVSMSPTLDPGEYVLISRSSYRLRTPDTFPLSSFPFPSASINGWSAVKRGDVVAFLAPHEVGLGKHPARTSTLAKRCVAIPGDTVRLAGQTLQVQKGSGASGPARRYSVPNPQERVREWIVPSKGDTLQWGTVSQDQIRRIIRRDGHRASFSDTGMRVDGQRRDDYVVKQDYYFVLGDNSDMSRDSRHWGIVPERVLLGEILGVVWPLNIWNSRVER